MGEVLKKKPERSCIGCGRKGSKDSFIRIVRSPEGGFFLDATGKRNGRGAYLCRNDGCFLNAIKRRALNRAFRETLPEDAYARLRETWQLLDRKSGIAGGGELES